MANLYDFSGVERNMDRFIDLYNIKQNRGMQERQLGLAERQESRMGQSQGLDNQYKQMLINRETEELKMKQDLMNDPGTRITIMSKALMEAYSTGGKKLAENTLRSFQNNPKYKDDVDNYTIDDFQFTQNGGIYAPIITTEGERLEGQYGFIDPTGKMHQIDMNKYKGKDKLPTSAKEFEYSKTLPEEELPAYKEFATKPKMSIDLGANKKFLDKLMESTAQDFTKQQEAARLSVQTIQNINDARSKLDAGIYLGAGANIKLGFDKWLRSAGLNIGGEKAANTEAFAGATGRLVGKIIKDFGSGTGLSDADRQYAERIAGGDITLTEQSIRKLFDISEKAQRVQIKAYNNLATQIENKYGKEELPFDMKIQEPEEKKPSPSTAEEYLKKFQ